MENEDIWLVHGLQEYLSEKGFGWDGAGAESKKGKKKGGAKKKGKKKK